MTIVNETDKTKKIVGFTYDATGSPLAMTYDGATYYYITNMQGDVVGLLDGAGNRIISYQYTAYGQGRYISHEPDLAAILSTVNPIGYRGYVMDVGTATYYCQSRYYDPAIGRFLNADAYPATGQGLTGNNMFAYCGNDPMNRKDDGGYFWHIVVGAVIGSVVNGALKVVENLLDDDPSTDWNDGLGLAMVTGAVKGGVAVTGCGPVVQMAVNATCTAVEGLPGVVKDIKNGENVLSTLGEYAFDIGLSAVTSYGPGLGSKGATNLGKQTIKRTFNAFKHNGFSAGTKELGKAAKWYWKSAKKMIGSNSWEQAKGFLNDLADTTIRNLIK